MNSKKFRQTERFLRNGFETSGEWGFPLIKKQSLDLTNIELIACSDTSTHDTCNLDKGVHFWVDDYRFESTYNNPEKALERLRKYRFLLTPDFSLYAEMDPWRQIESIGKSRWVGAYWQSQGITVIPTISWALPSSYRFCFDAIEKHSIVAIGMIGCKRNPCNFLRGYAAMMETIEPEAIICFGTPFREMNGNIISIDYVSSRKVVRYGR